MLSLSLSLSFPSSSLPGHLLPELRLGEGRERERRRVQGMGVISQGTALDAAGVGLGRRRPRRHRGVARRNRSFFRLRADHEADLARGVGRDRGVGVADASPVFFVFLFRKDEGIKR